MTTIALTATTTLLLCALAAWGFTLYLWRPIPFAPLPPPDEEPSPGMRRHMNRTAERQADRALATQTARDGWLAFQEAAQLQLRGGWSSPREVVSNGATFRNGIGLQLVIRVEDHADHEDRVRSFIDGEHWPPCCGLWVHGWLSRRKYAPTEDDRRKTHRDLMERSEVLWQEPVGNMQEFWVMPGMNLPEETTS